MNARFALLCVILVVCFTSAFAGIGKTWTSPAGNQYDFTKKGVHRSSVDGYTYTFAWFSDATEPNCKGTGCVFRGDSYLATSAVWWGNEGPHTIHENNSGNLTLFFDNGPNDGLNIQLTVYALCGSEATQEKDGNSSMWLTSPLACPKKGDDGLSGGAIFLIIVFSLLAAYFIIGFLVNKFYLKKITIADSIPHLGFWASLPGFYIAGCKIAIGAVRAKISGAKNNSGETYSNAGEYESDV